MESSKSDRRSAGFNLKPYVSFATAKIDPASHESRKVSMTPELLAQIEETIKMHRKKISKSIKGLARLQVLNAAYLIQSKI